MEEKKCGTGICEEVEEKEGREEGTRKVGQGSGGIRNRNKKNDGG